MKMVRYADDFVILCQDESQAEEAPRLVREWTKDNGSTLHPDKTQSEDGENRTAPIADGQTPTSPNLGFSPCTKPDYRRANPDEKTADCGAVRGRTARTVGRGSR